MSECFRKYYVCNNEIKVNEDFNDDILNEGKNIYEVIRIIDGVPLFYEDHMRRLYNSANIINKVIWYNKDEIKSGIIKLMETNKIYYGNVKLIFNFNEKGNSFLCYFLKHSYPDEEMYAKGVNTIFYKAERENPNAKIINLSLRESVNKKLKEEEVYEAILVDRNDYITEGSRSNIFFVRGEEVITSPLSQVLPGITRSKIIDLCKENNIKVVEERIKFNDINNIDALFISGTSPKVLPINRVEDMIFNSSQNKVVIQVMDLYNKYIENYIKQNK